MIPSLPELPAPPKRIIVHWTGGGYTPNRVDLSAYHFVVDGHGRVHAGVPVAANMRGIPGNTTTSEYGAHCARMNSFSVGVSYAAMAGARKGGTYGPSPLTEAQFLAGLEFVRAAAGHGSFHRGTRGSCSRTPKWNGSTA